MRNLNFLMLLILPVIAGCSQPNKKMEEKKVMFPYTMTITAPAEYPAEVHIGHFSNAKGFITAIPKVGIEGNGWLRRGSNGGLHANEVPSHLSLTWISFAEKKFWKADVDLPADKILALFQKGYTDLGGFGKYTHETYDNIAIGLAPGGVVVIWLQGRFFSTEIGRYQAKDTVVKKDDFRPFPLPKETEEEFYEVFFHNNTTPATRASIKQTGFPYKLWDRYREKYNWRVKMQFYKPTDKDTVRYNTYINGEQEVLYAKELTENPYLKRPVPLNMKVIIGKYAGKADFDENEIMNAFETLSKDNKDVPIELLAKVNFQYTGLTLTLVAGKKEIPLVKTKTEMYSFK